MHDETKDHIAPTDGQVDAAEQVTASEGGLLAEVGAVAQSASEPVSEVTAAPALGAVAQPAAGTAGAAPVVAQLAGARMPADRGMSSLGLLMQLGGTLGVTLAAVIAMTVTFGEVHAKGAFFLFAVLCGVRSAFHRMAGTALLYGKDAPPRRAIQTYLAVSLVQTALCLLIIKAFVDTSTLVQLGAMFLGWPVALGIYVSLPHVKALTGSSLPDAEDHGFEGAAVLMTVFGIMGALFAGLVLTVLLEDAEAALSAPASSIIVLVFIALLVRSVVHALGGMKAIGGASFDEASASAARYYNLGIVSAICIGITLFVVFMMSARNLGAALILSGFTMALLLAWPSIVRRLFAERHFHVYLAGSSAPTFRRAPDAGLIALGWLLVAMSLFSLSSGLIEALLGEQTEQLWAMAYGDSGIQMRSPWWNVGVSGLQLFAGIELVRMSERHKLAAMIYGVVSTVVVLYVLWPMIDSLGVVFAESLGSTGSSVGRILAGAAGFQLILAISTMVLVNRVTVPAAVVRVRTP